LFINLTFYHCNSIAEVQELSIDEKTSYLEIHYAIDSIVEYPTEIIFIISNNAVQKTFKLIATQSQNIFYISLSGLNKGIYHIDTKSEKDIDAKITELEIFNKTYKLGSLQKIKTKRQINLEISNASESFKNLKSILDKILLAASTEQIPATTEILNSTENIIYPDILFSVKDIFDASFTNLARTLNKIEPKDKINTSDIIGIQPEHIYKHLYNYPINCISDDNVYIKYQPFLINKDKKILASDIHIVPSSWQSPGGFSDFDTIEFNEYLKNIYNEKELEKLGFGETNDFNIQHYLLENNLFAQNTLSNGLAREYIRYEYEKSLTIWQNIIFEAEISENNQIRGAKILQINDNKNLFPSSFNILLSQFADGIVVELQENTSLAQAKFLIKLAQGMANESKPVFTILPFTLTSSPLHSVAISEGAIPILQEEQYLSDNILIRNLNDNRAIFTATESVAKVAVVYSLPSFMWNEFEALSIGSLERQNNILNLCSSLTENRIDYDVIVFGHPEFFDDRETLSRLPQYDIIILPGLECITVTQAQSLADFNALKKTIYTTSLLPIYDENINKIPWTGIRKLKKLKVKKWNAFSIGEIISKSGISEQVSNQRQIYYNLRTSMKGATFELHCLNIGSPVDILSATVELPIGCQLDTAFVLEPNKDKPSTLIQHFRLKQQRNSIELSVGPIEDYSVIILGVKKIIEELNSSAKSFLNEERKNKTIFDNNQP